MQLFHNCQANKVMNAKPSLPTINRMKASFMGSVQCYLDTDLCALFFTGLLEQCFMKLSAFELELVA